MATMHAQRTSGAQVLGVEQLEQRALLTTGALLLPAGVALTEAAIDVAPATVQQAGTVSVGVRLADGQPAALHYSTSLTNGAHGDPVTVPYAIPADAVDAVITALNHSGAAAGTATPPDSETSSAMYWPTPNEPQWIFADRRSSSVSAMAVLGGKVFLLGDTDEGSFLYSEQDGVRLLGESMPYAVGLLTAADGTSLSIFGMSLNSAPAIAQVGLDGQLYGILDLPAPPGVAEFFGFANSAAYYGSSAQVTAIFSDGVDTSMGLWNINDGAPVFVTALGQPGEAFPLAIGAGTVVTGGYTGLYATAALPGALLGIGAGETVLAVELLSKDLPAAADASIFRVGGDGYQQLFASGVYTDPQGEVQSFLWSSVDVDPFTNPAAPMDVNNDGYVSPLDVLVVINRLNFSGTHILRPEDGQGTLNYVDVNGDSYIAPLDALAVINHLNSQNGVGGEGESMSVLAAAPQLVSLNTVPGSLHNGATRAAPMPETEVDLPRQSATVPEKAPGAATANAEHDAALLEVLADPFADLQLMKTLF